MKPENSKKKKFESQKFDWKKYPDARKYQKGENSTWKNTGSQNSSENIVEPKIWTKKIPEAWKFKKKKKKKKKKKIRENSEFKIHPKKILEPKNFSAQKNKKRKKEIVISENPKKSGKNST